MTHPQSAVIILLGLLTLVAPFVSPLQASELTMGHGWSIHPDGGEPAALEAISKMREVVEEPQLIVMYTTAGYGEKEIAKTLRQHFPESKLFGMNVYKGVFSSDGLHIGPNGSLAVMGFSGGDLSFGVGAHEVTPDSDVAAVTRTVLAEAANDANRTLADRPSLILLGATKGKEDAIVRGIGETIDGDVPLVGGTHCDDVYAQGYVIGNDEIHKPGVIVGLIYSQEAIGASFYSGFIGKKKAGLITAGEGRRLDEIDGRPAQAVYRSWAEGHFDDIDSSKESVIVMSSAVCPLAKAITLPSGQMRYIPVRPWRFNPDGSLNMGGDIRKGDQIYYVEGNTRALKRRAGVVARDAMVNARIKMKNVAGGLHIYCGGAAKTLGLEEGAEADHMVAEITEAMGGSPFIGGFTAGEQGNIPGYGYFHGTLMSSMVVFPK